MRFKYFILSFFLFLSTSVQLHAQNQIQQLKNHLYYLASPELKGRFPGTKEDSTTVLYLQQHLKSAGLTLPFNNGLQAFNVVTSVEATKNNILNINGKDAIFNTDFSIYAFSSNAKVENDMVFAGFGIFVDTEDFKWNDFQNIDVKGKWVLMLKGDPEPQNNDSKFIPFADARTKVMNAKDRGAVGVIFTGGTQNSKSDDLAPLLFERAIVSAELPVLDVTRNWLNKNILPIEMPVDSLESDAIIGNAPFTHQIKAKVAGRTELKLQEVTTFNVIGIIEGSDPKLKDEYIVIGAHYDHLGMGGEGSGSRAPDSLAPHVGADDNGSGVVSVMELVSRFSQKNNKPKRSIAFVFFGAEEMGLLGSRYYTKNSPFPMKNIMAMINLDMVGRLNESSAVVVGGTGTSTETEAILTSISADSKIKLSYSPEGFGASDHASFYSENVPVMFFSTGAHADYHTPADTPDKINYEGMMEVIDLVETLTKNLDSRSEKLVFAEAGPKERATGRRGFKVTLGIMPDFTSSSNDGLGVGGVTKGGPADQAGMKKGDKIIGVNGKSVGTIYDYMNRLKQLKPGQRVNVDVNRDGQTVVLIVDL